MAGLAISSKVSLTLDLPPSCAQFCPAHPEYLVIGTYNLQKEEDPNSHPEGKRDDTVAGKAGNEPKKAQSRNGSLLVYKCHGSMLSHVQTLSQPSALLDLRFHPSSGKQDICAVVSSTGTLAMFKLDPVTNPGAPLQHVATSRCDDLDEGVLYLQCNWHPSDSQIIGVTTSTGLMRLLRLNQGWKIVASVDVDIENSLEAWCLAFAPEPASDAPSGSTTVYCGGDDSILRYNSYVVTGNDDELLSAEAFFSPISVKGHHDAGVTAILPLSLHEPAGGRLVVTGSYDDHVRLFAIHDPQESYGMRRVQLLTDKNLDGGVWRLDLVDTTCSANSLDIRILASCMYAGARLIQLRRGAEGTWSCEVLARFEEHKSMNYASAIVPRKQGDERLECISTSFYDKLLCLWKYRPNGIE